MQPSFWINAWKEGKRGFHLDHPNPYLCERAREVFGESGRILVPLCGATHDLRYLERCGYEAVGVEISPIAVRELADREGLSAVAADRFEQGGITVHLADFFEVTPERIGPVTGIWDRAALVALHPDQRAAYVAKQRELLESGQLLLQTLTYDATKAGGPPWSTPPEVVRELWPEARCILEEEMEPLPRFAEAGIASMVAHLYTATIG